MYRVFISSTWEDLRAERKSLERALRGFSAFGHSGMECLGSRPGTTLDESLAAVERADVYVGVIGGRYGSGYTEAEYERAVECKLPCFVFFKAVDAVRPRWRESDPVKLDRLAALRRIIRERHLVGPDFADPGELVANVLRDLHNWLVERRLGDLVLAEPGRPTPDHLSLLANRDSQAHQLDETVARERDSTSHRAQVFVLPGALNEEHEGLVRRFTEQILREAVERTGDDYVKAARLMDWPDPMLSANERLEKLRTNVCDDIELSRNSSALQISDALDASRKNWIFRYLIDARLWVGSDPQTIVSWVEFWRNLPPRRSGGMRFVFLCLLYPVPTQLSLWTRMFGGADKAMRRAVASMPSSDASGKLLLPELRPLRRVHVERWADTRCVRYYPELDCDVLKQVATEKFGRADTIAFADLKPSLVRAVRTARRPVSRADCDGRSKNSRDYRPGSSAPRDSHRSEALLGESA